MSDFPSIPMTTEETIEFNKWLEEHNKQIRAKAIEEFYNRLSKYKSDMNTANYPWNYVKEVYRDMQEEQK